MTDTTTSTTPPAPPSVPIVAPRRLPGSAARFVIDIKPPHDKEIEEKDRGRFERWFSLLTTIAIVIVVPTGFFAFVGSLLNSFFTSVGLLIGIGVGGFILSRLAHRLITYNPEWRAYVTNDGFKGTMVPYGPGYHPSHAWEERTKTGNYALDVITQPFTVVVPTKTAALTGTGTFQYRVNIKRLKNFVGVNDQSTIDNGLVAFIKSYLTAKLADQDAEKARNSIEKINQELTEEFMGHKPDGGVTPVEFEDAYGIITVNAILDGLAFSEAVQKTRDAIDEGEVLNKVVAAMLGISPAALARRMKSGEIKQADFDKYLGNALAVSENAPLNQNQTRIDIPALTALVQTAVPLIEKYLGGGTPPKKKSNPKRKSKPTGGTP